jgi:hypothetical protein
MARRECGTNTYVAHRKGDVGMVIEFVSEAEMVLVYEWFNADQRFRPFRTEQSVKAKDSSAIREWICQQAEAARDDHRNGAALYRKLWPVMLV